MPMIQINMLAGRSKEQKKEMFQAVTEAMVKSIGVKQESVTVYLKEYTTDEIAKAGKPFSELLG